MTFFRAFLTCGGFVDYIADHRDPVWQMKNLIQNGVMCEFGMASVEIVVPSEKLEGLPDRYIGYADLTPRHENRASRVVIDDPLKEQQDRTFRNSETIEELPASVT